MVCALNVNRALAKKENETASENAAKLHKAWLVTPINISTKNVTQWISVLTTPTDA